MARELRCDVISSIAHLGIGHIGGCLSAVELLTVLYFEAMRIDPKDPQMPGRDRFICSKGHAGPTVYAALANRGYFGKQKYTDFVNSIRDYANRAISLPDVLKAILNTVKNDIDNTEDPISEKVEKREVLGISSILHMLGFVMIGASPDENKCLVVDNVEDLIKVNNRQEIAISLEAAKDIYQALLTYAENIRDIYDDAGLSGSFHIVMALRRTTWDNLQAEFAGNFAPLLGDMFDITGDITITDLWNEKAYPTWKNHYESDYDEEAKTYIEEVNKLMNADETDRNSIQQRFSRLMSNGLRRQGHSLSNALYNMFYNARYGLLKGQDPLYIKKNDYDRVFSEEVRMINPEARYLRKSAAVEYYFMEQYTQTGIIGDKKVGGRWRSLNIGKITKEERSPKKYYCFAGERKTNGAEYPFTRWAFQLCSEGQSNIPSGFLLRQLLRVLAEAPEAERASRCVAPLYEAISLRTVMSKVLHGVDGEAIDNSKLLTLAEIILAGARPDTEGEYSPLYLFENGVDFKDIVWFKEELERIWNSSPEDSADGDHRFSRQKCGIRITEAGANFLHNIQPSFEFFSAMFCYDFAPLLFIKSPVRIEHVIGCIYHYATVTAPTLPQRGSSTAAPPPEARPPSSSRSGPECRRGRAEGCRSP